MKIKKLVLLMFLAAGLFATSQLPASVNASCEQCCIGSGGVCPQEGRVCCSGLSCSAPPGGGGTTCRSGGDAPAPEGPPEN
jgi:hypothetical protein